MNRLLSTVCAEIESLTQAVRELRKIQGMNGSMADSVRSAGHIAAAERQLEKLFAEKRWLSAGGVDPQDRARLTKYRHAIQGVWGKQHEASMRKTLTDEGGGGDRMTSVSLQRVVKERLGGVLYSGKHDPDSKACILEAVSVARKLPWTDDPQTVGMPDLRPLNDAPWSSDALRAEHMIRVGQAYLDWVRWTPARKKRIVGYLAIHTVKGLISELPGVPYDVREQCRAVRTVQAAARAAARAARAARAAGAAGAAARAAWAAEAAAWAARAARAAGAAEAAAWAAARAAAGDGGDAVLVKACKVWLAAVENDGR